MKKGEYRNARRSRRLICDALLELMEEKPLEKITVTDIVNRADVNRGTFYLHYYDINDVLSELQDTLIDQMEQYFENLDTPVTADNIMIIAAKCMKYIFNQNLEKYTALLFHHQLNFADKAGKSLQSKILAAKDITKDENTLQEIMVRASLLAYGIVGTFYAAATGTLDVSEERLSEIIDDLVKEMQYSKTQKH